MSAAIVSAFSTMVARDRARCSRAAPSPRPAHRGRRNRSRSSRFPVRSRRRCRIRSATSLRRRPRAALRAGRSARSVRQSLASSTAARVRLPECLSSFCSKRSNSVNASAVAPAKPASTSSLPRRRTLRALPFMMVLPSVTWPSPPITTLLAAADGDDGGGVEGVRSCVVAPAEAAAARVRVADVAGRWPLRAAKPSAPLRLSGQPRLRAAAVYLRARARGCAASYTFARCWKSRCV